MRFRPPPGVALAAGYSWSQLQLGSKDKLHVAQSDIKDYFYALGLPEDLQPFFCLPGIPVEMLEHFGVPGQQRVGLEDAEVCFPMLQVVPMGWNWAMWVAQRVHQHQSMIASNLSLDRILVDKTPAPDLSDGTPVLIPYADNLNVAGTDACKVQDVKDKVVAHLRGLGFKVHEELDACMVANSLGFRIDGELGTVQPIPFARHSDGCHDDPRFQARPWKNSWVMQFTLQWCEESCFLFFAVCMTLLQYMVPVEPGCQDRQPERQSGFQFCFNYAALI